MLNMFEIVKGCARIEFTAVLIPKAHVQYLNKDKSIR